MGRLSCFAFRKALVLILYLIACARAHGFIVRACARVGV